MKVRPRAVRSGQVSYVLPASLVDKRDEAALIVHFMSDRRLFGLAYSLLQPDYFDLMPHRSGVLIRPLVPTRDLFLEGVRPGDIDLLIIPYEDDDLILHRVMAIEAKAVRSTFARQGKSPNEFGFSQASALFELGIPYVAVAHLIVSDQSPEEFWREVGLARVLDKEGRAELLDNRRIDLMPVDLIVRTFGRLRRNCTSPELGLVSAYLDFNLIQTLEHSVWHPECQAASLNPKTSTSTLEAIAEFYHANALSFLDNPRYDPPRPPRP